MAMMGVVETGATVEADRSPPGLEELYRRHVGDARRLAYLLTGDHAAAEDVVQDAFVKVAGRLFAVTSPDAFPAYLRRAVVNTARSRRRSRVREDARLERRARLDGAGAHDGWGDAGRGDVWQALQQLPERQRAALVLRFWLDLSERRTAEVLRCRPGTVKSLVSRGLTTMRGAIGDA